MATKMQSSRDPYPFPKLQNDTNFRGTGNNQVSILVFFNVIDNHNASFWSI